MIVKNPRAGMLSNFEVLALVNEQQELQRAAQERDPNVEFPENLRTIQFEVDVCLIAYSLLFTLRNS